ncbi:glutamate--ammonia ligase [Claviceps purpurea]|nr:glutamate--ammonia ligase [Claviceps purpurea]
MASREVLSSRTETLSKYLKLEQKGSLIAEYVWIDAIGETRSKSRTLPTKDYKPEDLPVWNFDGSSTNQAPGDNSDVYLRPCAVFPDPFRGSPNIIVLTECWDANGVPNKYNYRHECAKVMEAYTEHEPWFGLEQEYTLLDHDDRPFGWPTGGFPAPQGPYYCGVGSGKVVMRDIVDAHYKACLYAGIRISGTNAEVMPGQWEYQVGPCDGISSKFPNEFISPYTHCGTEVADQQFLVGDELWCSRFFLARVAEDFGVKVSLHPKPIKGDWNGAGLHSNFSTKEMRADGGLKFIEEAIKKLEPFHHDCIKEYGEDNDQRLTGRHETGSINEFSSGVANRGASIRIPRETAAKGSGYFEDRRPASNADPYRVTKILMTSIFGKL